MANSILTIDMVTRKALEILENSLVTSIAPMTVLSLSKAQKSARPCVSAYLIVFWSRMVLHWRLKPNRNNIRP